MTPPATASIREQLGVRYERVLVEVNDADFPAQTVPRLAIDPAADANVRLALVDLAPGATIDFSSADAKSSAPMGTTITVITEGDRKIITNGEISIAIPNDGDLVPPFPGPIAGIRIGKRGEWLGASALVDAPFQGRVTTTIESIGPACIQWRTDYRWGGSGGTSFRARWASGADTILIVEEIPHDSDAAIEWLPLGEKHHAKSYFRGGGEGFGPMPQLKYPNIPGAARGQGRRLLGRISHICYWNQWNYGWVGFVSDKSDAFIGIFSGMGSLWKRRGHVRPEILEDDERGHFLRFPIKRGRRIWGLVVSSKSASDMESKERRTILNRRKTMLSDFRLDKVRHWELDPPLEVRSLRLAEPASLLSLKARLESDPQIAPALQKFLERTDATPQTLARFAAALGAGDEARMRGQIAPMVESINKLLESVADGGYERLIIFDGRHTKPVAYDLDMMWSQNLIEESDYRRVRTGLLAVAYMFVDPDYNNYEDFWPHLDNPDEGIVEALYDEMGDCPVPPNFASEFFTTTGVMAELFPNHPMAGPWRREAMKQLDRFGQIYYAPDGTYLESINYHQHGFNELLLHLWVLRHSGAKDYFDEPWVKGSFRHFVQVQMPALSNAMPDPSRGGTLCAEPDDFKRTPFPPNGNSGSEGNQQLYSGKLALGATVYRDSDPELAGQLMSVWRDAGKPILDHVHPLLTLLTLDPTIKPITPSWESYHRQTLGIISKSKMPDGGKVFALFRAGRCTHHMCFDQGMIQLAAWDRVLLGDYGYHAHDNDGKNIPAAATWVHSTIVYSENKSHSTGYTGLEHAPEAAQIRLDPEFDWCVHRITNTNFRDLDRLAYTRMLPCPKTVHVRHYLYVKPDYFLIWDVFEEAAGPSLFFLHPHDPIHQTGPGRFRAGEVGQPHLDVQFLLPKGELTIVENAKFGAMWSLAVRNETGAPYLTLLVPQKTDRNVVAQFDEAQRIVTVTGQGIHDRIQLPEPGSDSESPIINRNR